MRQRDTLRRLFKTAVYTMQESYDSDYDEAEEEPFDLESVRERIEKLEAV